MKVSSMVLGCNTQVVVAPLLRLLIFGSSAINWQHKGSSEVAVNRGGIGGETCAISFEVFLGSSAWFVAPFLGQQSTISFLVWVGCLAFSGCGPRSPERRHGM